MKRILRLFISFSTLLKGFLCWMLMPWSHIFTYLIRNHVKAETEKWRITRSQFLLTILKTIWNSKDEIIHKTWKLKRKKTLYISYAHSQYVKMLENQNRNWIRIDKKKSAKAYLGTFIPHDQKTIHVLFLQQKFLLKNEL